MITITHEVKMVDGKKKKESIEINVERKGKYTNDYYLSFPIPEAHELHTALGEKLKEIEANQ